MLTVQFRSSLFQYSRIVAMPINLLILLIAAFGISLVVVIDSSRAKAIDRPWCRMSSDKHSFAG